MQARTDTLIWGSPAPNFALPAANAEGLAHLTDLIAQHTVIVEFMRGTW